MRFILIATALLATACATTGTTVSATAPAAATSSQIAAALAPGQGTSLNPADAPSGAYGLDGRHASVIWRIRHMGLGIFTARFDTIAGTLNFDSANPASSSINVTIAANSVNTGVLSREGARAFDGEIAETLGAGANPNIIFASRSIALTGPAAGLIEGDLTLNGQTHPVTLEARFHGGRFVQLRGKHVLAFAGRTIINRSEWGVTNWGAFAGDQVEILIDAEFVQN